MRPSSILATLIATASTVALIACAAAPKQAGTRETPAPVPDASSERMMHSEEVRIIAKADEEIEHWRVEMGLSREPNDMYVNQFRRLGTHPNTCPEDQRATEGKCGDVCNLAYNICLNAEDICRIAGEMNGNGWAAEKCSKAKASCTEAEKACCNCDEDAVGGGGDDDGDPEANSVFWE